MRVFLAGASGAIGIRLVPQLVGRGHEVTGSYTSSPEKARRLRSLGAEAVALDLLDAAAVREAVLAAKPDAIIHQATALAGGNFSRRLDKTFALTNRLRTEGTDALLAAAREARVSLFIAQSFAPYRYAREGGMVKTEDDPLIAAPVKGTEQTFAAMAYLDAAVTAAGGVVLRYGSFYGDADSPLLNPVRRRLFPVIGNGEGVMSYIHLDDAATATVAALEHGQGGIYNVVDDDPAPLREWLPVLASVLGAKPPRHMPAWFARIVAGQEAVNVATGARGAANAKAKRELGWTLRYPSWRQGFAAAYGSPAGDRSSSALRDAAR